MTKDNSIQLIPENVIKKESINNRFEIKLYGKDSVAIDKETQLMWALQNIEEGEIVESLSASKMKLETMNIRKFAGFNNWHLPSVVEAESLIGKKHIVCRNSYDNSPHYFYLFSIFFYPPICGTVNSVYTSTSYENDKKGFIVNFITGKSELTLTYSGYYAAKLLAVRKAN